MPDEGAPQEADAVLPDTKVAVRAADFMLFFGGIWSTALFIQRAFVLYYTREGRAAYVLFEEFVIMALFLAYHWMLVVQLAMLLQRWCVHSAAKCAIYAWGMVSLVVAIGQYYQGESLHERWQFHAHRAALVYVHEHGITLLLAAAIAIARAVYYRLNQKVLNSPQ